MNIFVIIPTYNEKDNISNIILEILKLNIPKLNILVVDDNSPDGTASEVEKISAKHQNVFLLKRFNKKGRGLAGLAGFKYAIERDSEVIMEMDADFSHHPRYIPHFLESIKHADMIIGSRFIKGGSDKDRGIARRIITILAGFYIRKLLKLKVHDVSSGYRCFKKEALEKLELNSIISSGPSAVTEILYRAHLKNLIIKEIPIEFKDRKIGKTKLSWKILINSMLMVVKIKHANKNFGI